MAIYDAVQAGNLEAARERFQKLQPLYTFIRAHGVARTTKAAAELLGVSFGAHRPPLQALSGAAAAKLAQALREAGVPGPLARAQTGSAHAPLFVQGPCGAGVMS